MKNKMYLILSVVVLGLMNCNHVSAWLQVSSSSPLSLLQSREKTSAVRKTTTSRPTIVPTFQSWWLASSRGNFDYEDDDDDDDDYYSSTATSTSAEFAMDPSSIEAKEIMHHLELSLPQQQQLTKLAGLVNDWNSRINLISRKDCSKNVVFGRHILPSLAPMRLFIDSDDNDDDTSSSISIANCKKVVDVGTGGGFPGLPLAIAYPNVEFTLVDSVGKKLTVVEDMAKRLNLSNVKIHHGRAEALQGERFDMCIGRSVAAIPTYCLWIQHLLKEKSGHLVYLIGGDIEEDLLDQAIVDQDIDDLLNSEGVSDKRVLVFSQASVKDIAAASGQKIRVPTKQKITLGRNNKKKRARGAWDKKDSSQPKQRGYEGFKRFDSLNP